MHNLLVCAEVITFYTAVCRTYCHMCMKMAKYLKCTSNSALCIKNWKAVTRYYILHTQTQPCVRHPVAIITMFQYPQIVIW